MEEMCWKQFWETGNVTDYLTYREYLDGKVRGQGFSVSRYDSESEERIESDYSDRNGDPGITYR